MWYIGSYDIRHTTYHIRIMKLHTGDTVLIISGKDRGKTGTVLRVLREDNRVVVTGINIRTRHVKKTFEQAGRKLQYEASIAASNVMVLDPKTSKPSRVGYVIQDGAKKRISKVSGEAVAKAKPRNQKNQANQRNQKKEADEAVKEQPKKSSESSVSSDSSISSKKQPFWKRMKFGAAAMENAQVDEPSRSQQDHTIPSQELHVRKGGRGS